MKNLFIIITAFTIASCSNSDTKKEETTKDSATVSSNTGAVNDDVAVIPQFNGTIIYKNHAEGDSGEFFNKYAPQEYAVSVKGKKMRVKEVGGFTGLNLLMNFEDSLYYQFDNKAKMVQRVYRQPKAFDKIELKKTDEKEEIQGQLCYKYIVKSSPFVNKGTMQELWITDDFNFPYEQAMYLGENNFKGYLPLPVISDIGFGVILKAVTYIGNTTVTMEAYVIQEETLKENFEIPDNYDIK